MSYFGADTDAVQQTGKSVYDREPAATAAVTSLLNAYDDAASGVHHSKLSASLSAFRDRNQKGHLQLPHEIQRLGSNTASGGATVADAQNEATSVQKGSAVEADSTSSLLNRPLVP